jgi:ribonuclease HI
MGEAISFAPRKAIKS